MALCNQIIADQSSASFPEAQTEAGQLQTLRTTSDAVDAMAELLHDRVALLRGQEISWQRIANALGMSRQSAWERFR